LVIAALVLLALIAVDAALLYHRIDTVAIDVPDHDDDETTWLLVVTDEWARSPDRADDPDVASGSRSYADTVVLVTSTDLTTTAMTIAPDLVMAGPDGREPLTDLLADGPQAVVDGMCRELGIAVDHLAMLDVSDIAEAVDDADGVDVEVPATMRDLETGLGEVTPGLHHFDGRTALAYGQSLQPDVYVDGEWLPAIPDEAGRAERGSQVLFSLGERASPTVFHPLRTQRVGWNLSGSLVLSENVGLRDLLDLGDDLSWFQYYGEGIVDLPVQHRFTAPPTARLTRDGVALLRDRREGEAGLERSPCPLPGR
jgi:hypothetical protein